MHALGFSSEFAIYSVLSSGDSAIPLGRARSLIIGCNLPLASRNTPLKFSSLAGSLSSLGSPYGGSVKNRDPSDRKTSLNFRGKLSANVLRCRLPEFQDQPSSVPPGDR